MSYEFRVGMKVVCIEDGKWPKDVDGEICPYKGQVLTIRAFRHSTGGPEGLRFVEIVNAPRTYFQGFYECSFKAEHFRPLIETTEYRSERMSKFIKDVCANPKRVEIVE